MSKFKNTSKWSYSILYVVTFVAMLGYYFTFDNTEEVSESDSLMVAVPYLVISAIAAIVHWKKLLGTNK